jgi:hypothetical protein
MANVLSTGFAKGQFHPRSALPKASFVKAKVISQNFALEGC